ncbi:MAG: formate dehydrogenase beta subunit [Candidatus Nanopelagicales bacterium]
MRIYIPADSSARSVGADQVAARIFELPYAEIVRNGSRGLAWLEPLLEVETEQGRIAYGPVRVSDIDSLISADFAHGGPHPLRLGNIEEHAWFAAQDRVTFARVGLIDPLSLDDFRAHGGYAGLSKALALSGEEIVAEVTASGLRGRGGAGFPAGIKWRTVLGAEGSEKYVACNADEGDSGTFADRMLMEGDPFTLIEGMTIAALAVGATQGVIYVRSEYPAAISNLRAAIATANLNGWLGEDIQGSGRSFDIEVRSGAGAYICGEETSMLESLEGKRGQVRAKPPLPALKGLYGKPTVINNVLTLASVPMVLADGAAAYQARGVERSRGTQVFQLAGNIQHGGILELPFGVPLRQLVEGFGGGTRSGRPIGAVQVGGPLGAYFGADQLDLITDYEAMLAAGGMLGHGGIVVFDDTVDHLQQARFAMEFCAIESCGKCTPCRIGSTRGVETIDKIIAGQDVDTNRVLLDDLCELMTDGSLCALGGLTPLPVRSALKLAGV